MSDVIKRIDVDDILLNANINYIFTQYSLEGKHESIPEFNPSSDMYHRLEDAGMIVSVGLYHDDKLVGFATMVTSIMPHYGMLSSSIESIFILKEHRKFGSGKKMIDMLIESAKEQGSTNIFMSALIGSSLDRAAKLFGFQATNKIYSKKLHD